MYSGSSDGEGHEPLKKQSDLLLNADDLDAMWVCLRENCVIDDATGTKKVSLTQARIDMNELDKDSDGFLQPHVWSFHFSAPWPAKWNLTSVFLVIKLCDLIILYVLKFSMEQEMGSYIKGLIRNMAQLRDMPTAFEETYCCIAAHNFFFFCEPHKRGWPTNLSELPK
ncbi:putative serine/threonine-protein phosphatase 2A regulatory subunit B'' subunit TON2 [Abeliophyllum distichum]|uniref:Serine/threonine-protein phosphatase 2A regulatory subunit B'' subunit TON2 n=1 Tax=Abeliophyllum distichum TaxID=126358 RepID=A0ABD1SX87_9LAMI